MGAKATLEPGMVVSVESYIGEKGGREGVKLEEEVLVTENGAELISRFPYEDDLLSTGHNKAGRCSQYCQSPLWRRCHEYR